MDLGRRAKTGQPMTEATTYNHLVSRTLEGLHDSPLLDGIASISRSLLYGILVSI